MIKSIKRLVSPTVCKLLDAKINERIIVFESDDWGSIRMSSKQSFDYFLKKGFDVGSCAFNRNDSLESNDDLRGLLETLSSVQQNSLSKPSFTLNMILANPDFEFIKATDYNDYRFEPFQKTLNRYIKTDEVLNIYRQGIESRNFVPQFHGREHVHVQNWLSRLKENDKLTVEAFNREMFTLNRGFRSNCKLEVLDSLAIYDVSQIEFVKTAIQEGLALFESLWGFKSATAIAPCYTWDANVENELFLRGVTTIQSGRSQCFPLHKTGDSKFIFRYLGEMNKLGQMYLVRNVSFEPSTNPSLDWVDTTLKNIEKCFSKKVPAIVASHRLNYIGSISSANRDQNLKLLQRLLLNILKKWPDVQFMTSPELASRLRG